MAEAFPFTDRITGQAQTIDVYVDSHNKASTLIAGIYADNSGHPGARLGFGSISSPKGNAWDAISIPSTLVTAGQTYWLTLLGTGGFEYFRDQAGGPCNSENSSQWTLKSLPGTWTSGAVWNTCPISAYVGGTAGTTTTTTTPTTTTTTTTAPPPVPPVPPPPVPPVNSAAPQISGTATQGQALSTSNGSWAGSPTSYTYQWQDCSGSSCVNVPGATSSSYTLTAFDVGVTVRAMVTATNAAGSTPATSPQTAAVAAMPAPAPTAMPQASGTTTEGDALSTSNGSWTGSPTAYGYQWEDCNPSGTGCANITGATAESYTLIADDVGDTMRVVVTATNAGGSAAASSPQTATIAAPAPAAPANTTAPAVTGSTVQGQTLSTSNGSWTNSPSSFTYQWQDCNTTGTGCANITGATASTYTLTANDVGDTVRSVVTASNSGGSTPADTTATGTVTVPAPAAPANTTAPAVTGSTVQGQTLSTSNGSWTNSPSSFTYQWQDCNTTGTGCANITGATASTYTLAANDVGDTVRSVVTASNSGGSTPADTATTASVTASGGGQTSNFTCTQHVTTSTFSSAFSSAGSGAVLCLAPGSYGSFSGSSKSSMVVITPDVSVGATAPTGNATGDVNGNVTFSGADFSPAANITMDGITFTGDVSLSGATHDITLHDSLFHQHLVITDTSMTNADVVADYDMFPGDTADCVNGPEGRIWINESGHSSTPDGVTIENSNIGGTASQCDGIQTGGYEPQILNNWFHDYHYAGDAHTDGIQDYGGTGETVKGNFMYNVPDCYVSYDGTSHADIENNVCVNDGTQNNGASPNVLVINDDNGSIVKHNTLVAFMDSYENAGGMLEVGSKSSAGSGTVLSDNVATGFDNCENGNCRPYTESHNLFIHAGPGGTGDVTGTPIYQGGACGSLTSSQPPFCSDSWSNYLLASNSPGHDAADDGTDMGAYGPGPVTPGGPA